jgi:hypothetical protein
MSVRRWAPKPARQPELDPKRTFWTQSVRCGSKTWGVCVTLGVKQARINLTTALLGFLSHTSTQMSQSSMHAPHDGAACMCTHGLDGDEEHMSSTENGHGRTCSAADADSGRRPRSAVGGTALRIGACVQSAVACTGTELETYVGRAGCFAFLPGSWLCWGRAVRSSGSSCSGRFDCTSVIGTS